MPNNKVKVGGVCAGQPAAHSERGASLVEYVLLIMLIAVIAIVAVRSFGNHLSTTYSGIVSTIDSAVTH